ncbi:MAG: HMA2 domain-containing protein [Desulfomonilaceae bacterium]
MIPDAHVSHGMARRLRIKIPSKRGEVSYFSTLRERLSGCPGVGEIRVNPQTGSALISYECQRKTIVEFAREHNLFLLKRSAPRRKSLFGNVADTFQGYNQSLKHLTGGEVDIPSLIFVSLVTSGIWQIARGNLAMPAWYTAFYYALGVFTRAQIDEWDEGEDLGAELDDADGD